MSDDPRRLAEACSQAMHANDDAARALGIEILESTPGRARLALNVERRMTNGHDVCHGGVLFTLADTAFAHASNNRNRITVAAAASIQFLAPAQIGDRLIATAFERARGKRSGVYDIEIHNQDNRLIALFRGNAHQIRGQIIPSEGEPAP
jgi:acyl-CoA thioesterase